MIKPDYTVKDFMTANPHFIGAGETVLAAKHKMEELNIRHLPVLEEGTVIGIVSDRDIKMAIGLIGAAPDAVQVRHIGHESPYCVDPDTPLGEVTEEMAKHRYGSAIVVQNGKLVGIFTTVDACRAITFMLRQVKASTKS